MITALKRLTRRLPPTWALGMKEYRDVQRRLATLERESARALYWRPRPSGFSQAELVRSMEAKIHSQNGEDGITALLFCELGTTNKRFVEIGVEDGRECNSACLSLYHDWEGLLVDSDQVSADRARAYYTRHLVHRAEHVTIACEHVTAENIDMLLERHGYSGEIDLLSIDIDGNDYWVWEAMTVVRPAS